MKKALKGCSAIDCDVFAFVHFSVTLQSCKRKKKKKHKFKSVFELKMKREGKKSR